MTTVKTPAGGCDRTVTHNDPRIKNQCLIYQSNGILTWYAVNWGSSWDLVTILELIACRLDRLQHGTLESQSDASKIQHWACYLSVLHAAMVPHVGLNPSIRYPKSFPSDFILSPLMPLFPHGRLASPSFYACHTLIGVCKRRLFLSHGTVLSVSLTLPFPSRKWISADEAACKNCVFYFSVKRTISQDSRD